MKIYNIQNKMNKKVAFKLKQNMIFRRDWLDNLDITKRNDEDYKGSNESDVLK